METFIRTEWLIGSDALQALGKKHVAVFGIGGVGSYVAEALARSGVGTLTLIDHDVIAASNINRQLHSLHSTIGREKVKVMGERILDINPQIKINALYARFLPDNHDWDFDYLVDAVDTVDCKIRIILQAEKRKIPIISAMGAGNRLDPTKFKVGDIYETRDCPLAKVMRGLCRKNGIKRLKVVYSTEPPIAKREKIGSIAFVPCAAGLVTASEVVKGLVLSY